MADSYCFLGDLPDTVLLNIFRYLSFADLQNIAQTNQRFHNIRHDRTLVSKTNLNGFYWMTDAEFKAYTQTCSLTITSLDVSNCYWFTSRYLVPGVRRCKSLRELHVVNCSISVENLVSAVSLLYELETLSFGFSSFENLRKDTFKPARRVLGRLKKLSLTHYSRQLKEMAYIGQYPTLLDYCNSLEELIIDAVDMSIPELYRPLLSDPGSLSALHSIRLTSTIHAGSQMLFYGVLTQLPETRSISWRSVIMPNVNFAEFSRKVQCRAILDGVNSLTELDVSGSRDDFVERTGDNGMVPGRKTLDFSRATELRYLNVAKTRMGSGHLLELSSAAHKNLTSINMFGCERIFTQNGDTEGTGLMALFSQCESLRHVNIGGVHHHVLHNDNCQPQTRWADLRFSVISQLKNLKSLCVPTCTMKDKKILTMPCTGIVVPPSCRHGAKRPRLDGTSARRGWPGSSRGAPVEEDPIPPSLLEILINENPDLVTLELISVGFISAFHRNYFISSNESSNCHNSECIEGRFVLDKNLSRIGQLKDLTSLTIVGCVALSGACFVEIAKGCSKLERLSIANVGNALMAGGGVLQSFPHFRSLRDLRIEQNVMSMSNRFFTALAGAKKLERLCIVSKHSSFKPTDLIRLVDRLPKLVVIQMFTDATLTSCRMLKSSLNKRFSASRPALSVAIHPPSDDGIREIPNHIPSKHFNELTRFSSNVAFLPPRIQS